MKYYLDFEANNIINEIISIGCVREDGKEFFSLVKPKFINHVDWRITKITHLQKKDFKNAPILGDVMRQFSAFIEKDNDTTFITYGDGDAHFIDSTLSLTNYVPAINTLKLIKNNLINFSPIVQKHYKVNVPIKLIKVYNRLNNSDDVQQHDALDDARMLKFVAENIQYDICENSPFPEYNDKPPVDRKPIHISIPSNNIEKDFISIGAAANWLIGRGLFSDKNCAKTYIRRQLNNNDGKYGLYITRC